MKRPLYVNFRHNLGHEQRFNARIYWWNAKVDAMNRLANVRRSHEDRLSILAVTVVLAAFTIIAVLCSR